MRRLTSYFLIFVFISITLLLATGLSLWNQRNMNRESSDLALAVTQQVLSSTSADALLEAAHPQLTADMNAEQWQRYSEFVHGQMGALQALVAIRGGVSEFHIPLLSETPEARYVIDLQFAAAEAEAEILLRRDDDHWQITGFFIDSDLLGR